MIASLALIARLMLGNGEDPCRTYEAESVRMLENMECIQAESEDIICEPRSETVLRALFVACNYPRTKYRD